MIAQLGEILRDPLIFRKLPYGKPTNHRLTVEQLCYNRVYPLPCGPDTMHQTPDPNPVTELLILIAAITVLISALFFAFSGGP